MEREMEKREPVDKLYDGRLTAAIWENKGDNSKFYNVTLKYSYKDQEGKWRDTSSIPGNELLKAARLAELAYGSVQRLKDQDRAEYIEQQRAAENTRTREHPRER